MYWGSGSLVEEVGIREREREEEGEEGGRGRRREGESEKARQGERDVIDLLGAINGIISITIRTVLRRNHSLTDVSSYYLRCLKEWVGLS